MKTSTREEIQKRKEERKTRKIEIGEKKRKDVKVKRRKRKETEDDGWSKRDLNFRPKKLLNRVGTNEKELKDRKKN